MFTTTYIDQAFKIIRGQKRPPYNVAETEQKTAEDALIQGDMPCPAGQGEKLGENTIDIETKKVLELTKTQFYNLSLMDYIRCMTDVVIHTSKYVAGALADNYHIQRLQGEFLKDIKQIGAESVSGYAMRASLKEAKDLYILKASRNPSEDELTHELVVGLMATNRLRQYCPNFAYIYGGFKCSPPVIDEKTKDVKAICTTMDRNGIRYVIYENIADAVDMAKYVRTCSGEEFLMAYMQIVYALKKAVEQSDFTHYDLHSENVLIRPLPQGMNYTNAYIPYMTEKGVFEKLRCSGIATIIDYGRCHINVNNKYYGYYGLESASTLPDKSFPMYDAYKLLMFCASDALSANNQNVLKVIRTIFTFFNRTDKLEQAIKDQSPSAGLFYAMPYTEDTAKITFDDLAKHIRQNIDCSFIVDNTISDLPNLVCDSECLSYQNIDTAVFQPGANQPKNFWELYDYIYDGLDIKYNYDPKTNYDTMQKSFEEESKDYVMRGDDVQRRIEQSLVDFSEARTKSLKSEAVKQAFADMAKDLLELKDILLHLETMTYLDRELASFLQLPSSSYIKTAAYNTIKTLQTTRMKAKIVVDRNIKAIETNNLKSEYANSILLLTYAA